VAGRVADVFFYGPLGLALEHRKLLPQLADRGRRQIALTRTIGHFTVRHGQQRLTGLIDGFSGGAHTGSAPVNRVTADSPPPGPAPEPAGPPAGAAESLAIPQYDSLSAIQVVPRLDGLTRSELVEIHRYETATRSRRTILAKISQLRQ
jgi:hypothetical protein